MKDVSDHLRQRDQARAYEPPEPGFVSKVVSERLHLPPEDLDVFIGAAFDLEKQVEAARESPLALLQLCIRQPNGKPLFIPDFYYEWDEMLRTEPRFLICAPRGTGKSAMAIAGVLWAIGNCPNLRVKWIGPKDSNAQKRLAVIHSIIDNKDHIYHKVFPHIKKVDKSSKRKNNQSQLNLERDLESPEPTVEALGVMSSGVGGRSDLQVMDDFCDESNTILNPAFKPKVLAKLQSDHLGTLVPEGLAWAIFTPWANDDANSWLKDNAGWAYKEYPHGKPGDAYYSIFPQLWSSERLKERRRFMGELGYARAYLLKAHTKETVAILPEHLREWDRNLLTPDKILRGYIIVTVDPASGKNLEKGGLDPTGVSVCIYVPKLLQPTKYDPEANGPLDPAIYWTGKGVPFEIFFIEAFEMYLPLGPEMAQMLWWLASEFNAHAILSEAESLADLHTWLEQERRLMAKDLVNTRVETEHDFLRVFGARGLGATVIPVTSGNLSKGERLLSITPYLNLPEGDPPCIFYKPQIVSPYPVTERFIHPKLGPVDIARPLREQYLSFPTRHEDVLDTTVHSIRFIVNNLAPRDAYGIFQHGDAPAAVQAPIFISTKRGGDESRLLSSVHTAVGSQVGESGSQGRASSSSSWYKEGNYYRGPDENKPATVNATLGRTVVSRAEAEAGVVGTAPGQRLLNRTPDGKLDGHPDDPDPGWCPGWDSRNFRPTRRRRS